MSIFEAFAIFCGLGIHNTQMYENACKLMAKQKVALECLSYHASASVEDTERLYNDFIPSVESYNLLRYFTPLLLTKTSTSSFFSFLPVLNSLILNFRMKILAERP